MPPGRRRRTEFFPILENHAGGQPLQAVPAAAAELVQSGQVPERDSWIRRTGILARAQTLHCRSRTVAGPALASLMRAAALPEQAEIEIPHRVLRVPRTKKTSPSSTCTDAPKPRRACPECQENANRNKCSSPCLNCSVRCFSTRQTRLHDVTQLCRHSGGRFAKWLKAMPNTHGRVKGRARRVRDPLHILIALDPDNEWDEVYWKILSSRDFQRPRRIKQLGFSEFVYPGVSHSRFSHSLGAFQTARQLIQLVGKLRGGKENPKDHIALGAALLHDIGHGPFSHAFEDVCQRLKLPMVRHEAVSKFLIRNGRIAEITNEISGSAADEVSDMITGTGAKTVHNAAVSSQCDADRLDYMR